MPAVAKWKRAYTLEEDEAEALWQWKEHNKAAGESIRKLIHIANELPVPRHLLTEATMERDPQFKGKLWGFINGIMKKREKQGVTAGVYDYFTPVARGKYHGLFLELKTARGVLSKSQKRWKRWVEDEGYAAAEAFGWQKAVEILVYYEGLGPYKVEQGEDK